MRQRPEDLWTIVTPLLARAVHWEPPFRQETFPHFGFGLVVETRTCAQTAGRWITEAIWIRSFVVGLRSACATPANVIATITKAARVRGAVLIRPKLRRSRPGGRNGPCTRPRDEAPGRVRCAWLGPGLPASHAGYRLRLLPSGPDLVHGPTLRRTWPSTPPAAALTPRASPS